MCSTFTFSCVCVEFHVGRHLWSSSVLNTFMTLFFIASLNLTFNTFFLPQSFTRSLSPLSWAGQNQMARPTMSYLNLLFTEQGSTMALHFVVFQACWVSSSESQLGRWWAQPSHPERAPWEMKSYSAVVWPLSLTHWCGEMERAWCCRSTASSLWQLQREASSVFHQHVQSKYF